MLGCRGTRLGLQRHTLDICNRTVREYLSKFARLEKAEDPVMPDLKLLRCKGDIKLDAESRLGLECFFRHSCGSVEW
jgi:hypothetical protein